MTASISRRARRPESAPTRQRLPAVVAIVAACLALGVFGWIYLRLWGFVQDDAFISLRYAKHLAQGQGLVYNVGERVEGYTNFLWTALLAVPFLLNWGLVPFLKIASATFALLSGYATWRLGRAALLKDEGGPHPLALLAALLFILNPIVAISAAEGLETMMFTFFLVLATALFCEESRPGALPWSALVAAALAMTRPDGVIFGVWLGVIAILWRRGRRYLIAYGLIFLGLFSIYFAIRSWYYGDLLPNTFYAKRGGSVALLERGWAQLLAFIAVDNGWIWLAGLVTLFSRRTRAVAIALSGIVALRVAFHLWSGGPWMERHRFLVPILPFLYILTIQGIALWRAVPLRRIALAVACVLMLLPALLSYPLEESRALGYGFALRRAHGALGSEIDARTRPSAVLAMDDAGLAPLLADRVTIDMLGLNDRHIAHLPGAFGKFDVDYVLGRRPDLIVLVASVPDPVRDEEFLIGYHARIFRSPVFGASYRFARRFDFGPGYYLLAYRRIDSSAVPADF